MPTTFQNDPLGFILLRALFSLNNLIWVLLYLVVMVFIAALEATSRQVRTYSGHYQDSLIAVAVGGAIVGAYGCVVVFNPSPWYSISPLEYIIYIFYWFTCDMTQGGSHK